MSGNLTENRITVADMAPHIHSFLPNENKVEKLTNWLANWIDLSLDCGKIKPYDFLPSINILHSTLTYTNMTR